MPSLEATSWSTRAWAREPGPAAPRTSASLSAGTRPVAEIRSATSSASALIGGGVPPRRAPPGGAAASGGGPPGVRSCGGRSLSIYPSFEVSAGRSRHLMRSASTIPLSEPISPTVRDAFRSPLACVWLPVLAAAVVTPLLWVLGASEARRGRVLWAGALVGLTAGLELWGVLGARVILLAPHLRDAVKGLAVAVGVVAAQLAPFALFGNFHMFDYQWRVATGTLLATVVPVGTHFGWPLRLLQAGIACGLGGAVALRFRRSVPAVWLTPLLVVLVRIALDPLAYGWYWLEAESLALVGAGLVVTAPPFRARTARQVGPVGPP